VSKGIKFDTGKPRWSLLPWEQVEDVVKVFTHGAVKYSDDNWKKIDNIPDRYFSAGMRHINSWKTGSKNDEESGLPHLAHAICCLLMLMWSDRQGAKK
jgi:hypothetical protein